jgi:hypothetical protein
MTDYNANQRQRMIRDFREDFHEWEDERQKDANWFTAFVIAIIIVVAGVAYWLYRGISI